MPDPISVDHHLEPVFPIVEEHFIPQHPSALAHIGQSRKVFLLFGSHLLHHHGIHPDPGYRQEDPVVGPPQADRRSHSFGNPVHPVMDIGFLHQFLSHQIHRTGRINAHIRPIILIHTFFHQSPKGSIPTGYDDPLDLFSTDFFPYGLGFRKSPHRHVLETFGPIQPHELPGNAFHIVVDPVEKILLSGIVVVDQDDSLESIDIYFMTQHDDLL